MRLKEQTLRWQFKVEHVPGVKNVIPDLMSRQVKEVNQVEALAVIRWEPEAEDRDRTELLEDTMRQVVASASPEPLSVGDIKEAMQDNIQLQLLVTQIEVGFPEERKLLRVELKDFWRHRDNLSVQNGVAMFKDRIVVPEALRGVTLEILHAAHQGVKGMQMRADKMVWWPGLAPAIIQMRNQCRICQEIAPSQANLPPVPLRDPDYPFQLICADHFAIEGGQYLVIVDRFSGWPVVEYCGQTVGSAGNLVAALRRYFGSYGVPEELSTDGSTVFTSELTTDFLRTFKVNHRLSSPHNPHSK